MAKHSISALTAALLALSLTACRMAKTDWDMSGQDTVATSEFAPVADTIPSVDLRQLTGLPFPAYHVADAQPIMQADSTARADDETLASGNYELTVKLDTVVTDTLYAQVTRRAAIDSLWQLTPDAATYTRHTKAATYTISLQRGSKTVTVKRRRNN